MCARSPGPARSVCVRAHWPASPFGAMANVGHSSTPRPIYARRFQNNRQLHQRGSIRASPIEGSGAHRRGDRPDRRRALAGRERSPFTLIATAATLAAGVRNPMFDVLGSDVMWRRAITPGAGFSFGGTNAELFKPAASSHDFGATSCNISLINFAALRNASSVSPRNEKRRLRSNCLCRTSTT